MPAHTNYHIFLEMLMTAMISSLCDMSRQNLHRVVIAPLSCGLYAGPWSHEVRNHFHQICHNCLDYAFIVIQKEQDTTCPLFLVRDKRKYLFETVWIPKFE